MEQQSSTADREITITREINAPRELVFDAWSDHNHLDKWWGPKGYTNVTESFEFKPGGIWQFMMYHAEYGSFLNTIVFDVIERPSLIVYTNSGVFQSFVTFTGKEGKTELSMRIVFNSAEEMRIMLQENGASEGGKQTLAKLEEYVLSM